MRALFGRYISLQLKRAWRLVEEAGFLRVLLLAVLLFPIWAGILHIITLPYGGYVFLLLALIILVAVHLSRRDALFLELLAPRRYRLLMLIDYLLISAVFIAGLLFSALPWLGAVLPALLVLMVYLVPPGSGNKRFFIRKIPFVPPAGYEWISGLRRNMAPFAMIVAAGVAFSIYMAVPLVAVFLLGLLCMNFYQEGEPYIFLQLPARRAGAFIRQKAFQAVWYFLVSSLPLWGLFFVLHYTYWYLMAYLLLACCGALYVSVIIKYAFYTPATRLQGRVAVFAGLALFSFAIPFLLPLPLFMGSWFWPRAVNNLKTWLHAYDT